MSLCMEREKDKEVTSCQSRWTRLRQRCIHYKLSRVCVWLCLSNCFLQLQIAALLDSRLERMISSVEDEEDENDSSDKGEEAKTKKTKKKKLKSKNEVDEHPSELENEELQGMRFFKRVALDSPVVLTSGVIS